MTQANKTEKRQSRRRRYTIALLLCVTILASTFTFSYWANEVLNPGLTTENREVYIGEGSEINTTIRIGDEEEDSVRLVPEGYGDPSKNYEEEVTLDFKVFWESDIENAAKGTQDVLNFEVKEVKILDADEEDDSYEDALKCIECSFETNQGQNIIADGDPVDVQLVFTLDEPGSKSVYDLLINKTIEVEIQFWIPIPQQS